MSDLESKAVDILDKLEALTTQYTPEVIEKAVQAVSVSGVASIVEALLGLVVAYGLFLATKNLGAFFMKKKEEDGDSSDWEIGYCLTYFIGGVATLITVLASLIVLFSVWNWVAIFNPELAIAHKILGL